jgi:hypothetical protein
VFCGRKNEDRPYTTLRSPHNKLQMSFSVRFHATSQTMGVHASGHHCHVITSLLIGILSKLTYIWVWFQWSCVRGRCWCIYECLKNISFLNLRIKSENTVSRSKASQFHHSQARAHSYITQPFRETGHANTGTRATQRSIAAFNLNLHENTNGGVQRATRGRGSLFQCMRLCARGFRYF